MKARIVVTPRADRDLDDQFAYIAESNPEAAVRFLHSAQATFQQLAVMPEMGGLREFQQPELTNLRVWQVRGFEKYLIFYRPIERGIEIVRVLHGARNIAAIFEEDDCPPGGLGAGDER